MNGRFSFRSSTQNCTHALARRPSTFSQSSCLRLGQHVTHESSQANQTCQSHRRVHSTVVHVASTDSQDMEDLDAEMEEEMDSAYEEGVNVDVVPGANLSRNTGRRLKRQEESAPQAGGRRGKKEDDGFDQRILQISRVTKVVKGGKQISFRAVVAIGDGQGSVGVGTASAKEIAMGVRKAIIDAQNNMISIPLTRGFSFPHKQNGIAGGAKVMLRPASEGTGVIAGGAVREVLELSGVKNGFGKQLGSDNPLNNARATIDGLAKMRTLQMAARNRDLTVEQMLGAQ